MIIKFKIVRMINVCIYVFFVIGIISCNRNKTLVDPQGNEYSIVVIGDQIWMNENLNFEVENLSFCYDDNSSECDSMGRLYNWEGAQKAADQISGWRLPSKKDWIKLIEYYGGDSLAFERIVNNSEGFKIKPAGVRLATGKYVAKQFGGVNYWSSTSADTSINLAYSVAFMKHFKKISPHNYPKNNACSVRLIKDNN